jgi:hypothetical protein
VDLMFFSKKYYRPGMNDNNQGLIVLVDRFSGYLAVRPISFGEKQKSADVVTRKVEGVLTGGAFPRAKHRTIFHDNGVEFRDVFPTRMAQLGYNDVVISQSAGAPSPHAERAVGIIRKLINQKLSANDAPRKDSQRWWPMARQLVSSYNDTPMTDGRAPHTPNQLKSFRGARAAAMVKTMQTLGSKRIAIGNRSRKAPDGSTRQKTVKMLQIGDRVRVALEKLSKDGSQKRPFPKQRWSSTVYKVAKILRRKIGFARYAISKLPRQRFEREDLQRVGGPTRRSGSEEASGDDEKTEHLVAKQASKRRSRYT